MAITVDNKILIRELMLSQKWRVKKVIRVFPNKNWKSSPLKDLLRKIDKTGDVQHYPGSGRPGTVRVPDNISTVEDLILSQCNDINMLLIKNRISLKNHAKFCNIIPRTSKFMVNSFWGTGFLAHSVVE